MEKLTIKALDKMIDDIIKNNQDEIMESLFSGTNDSMEESKIYSIMIWNCLSLSMKLTSRFLLDLLQSQGVFEIDEREIAKLLLKHLSSDLKE